MSMDKQGQPEPILPLANNPETLTAEEIEDTLERGGPWITVEFVSNDNALSQKRVMNLEEAEGFYADLGVTIAETKSKYNILTQPEAM